MPANLVLIGSQPCRKGNQPFRVECLVDGLDIPYQLRIWIKSSNRIWLLVKNTSTLLPLLNPGDTLNLRCYYTDFHNPSEKLKTAVMRLTRRDEGPFKGDYLLGLEILESQNPAQSKKSAPLKPSGPLSQSAVQS